MTTLVNHIQSTTCFAFSFEIMEGLHDPRDIYISLKTVILLEAEEIDKQRGKLYPDEMELVDGVAVEDKIYDDSESNLLQLNNILRQLRLTSKAIKRR